MQKHIRTTDIGETVRHERGRKLPAAYVYTVPTFCGTVRPFDATARAGEIKLTYRDNYCPDCLKVVPNVPQ